VYPDHEGNRTGDISPSWGKPNTRVNIRIVETPCLFDCWNKTRKHIPRLLTPPFFYDRAFCGRMILEEWQAVHACGHVFVLYYSRLKVCCTLAPNRWLSIRKSRFLCQNWFVIVLRCRLLVMVTSCCQLGVALGRPRAMADSALPKTASGPILLTADPPAFKT